jgi:hypothetical protein
MYKTALLSIILTLSTLHARDVIDDTGLCKINWTIGSIRCEGESESGQSKYAAKVVSKVIAQRNMLEVIQGVQIDSTTTVKDGITSSDVISSRVNGVIRGAQIISNIYNSNSKSALATVEIKMGKDLLSALLSDPNQLTFNEKIEQFFNTFSLTTSLNAHTYTLTEKDTLQKILEDLQNAKNTQASNLVKQKINAINTTHYSGILLDISEVTNFKKAMIVKLVNEQGKEIYPAHAITKEMLMKKNTSVGYMFGFEDARNNSRVYSIPLELKPQGVYKNKHANLVLNKQQIKQLKSLDKSIFKNAKIILVLGD